MKKEQAIELGEVILKLKSRVMALSQSKMDFRVDRPGGQRTEPDLDAVADRIQQEESHRLTFRVLSERMRAAIGESEDESTLIHVLLQVAARTPPN